MWPCFASKKKVISLFMEIDHFWIETFVITPVLTIFPILPIIAPSVQIFLYVINEAKTLSSCFKPPSKNLLHSVSFFVLFYLELYVILHLNEKWN